MKRHKSTAHYPAVYPFANKQYWHTHDFQSCTKLCPFSYSAGGKAKISSELEV